MAGCEQGRRDATERALKIAARIAARDDLRVHKQITNFGNPFKNSKKEDRKGLGIANRAWRRVRGAGVSPQMVFAHPTILKDMPQASLHYRGIALLPRKRVQGIAGAIDTWESSPEKARVSEEKALRVCRLYNAVISSIVLNDTNWTVEDGYRNILATIGITEDGAMRNIVGQEIESLIKERILDWVRLNDLLVEPSAGSDRGFWQLVANVRMFFGTEPDIAFEKDEKLAVLIEVKGGRDPAGALERLGAAKKTFDEAPVGCRNFLVVGVVTPAMRERLDAMGMVTFFEVADLIDRADVWADFMNEIFHHALRIAPER